MWLNLFLKIVGIFLCTTKMSSIIESIFEYLNNIEKLLHKILFNALLSWWLLIEWFSISNNLFSITIYDKSCILFLLISRLSILMMETILLMILRQKQTFEMKFFLLVWIQYFKSWDSFEDKKTILPSSISLTIIFPWNIISNALIKLISYLNDFLIVVYFKHGSWKSFDVNIWFFYFDIAIKISKIFGFHVHTFENGDKSKDSKLFVGFVSVVVDGEFLNHFGFNPIDSFFIRFEFWVVIFKLSLKLANDIHGVF